MKRIQAYKLNIQNGDEALVHTVAGSNFLGIEYEEQGVMAYFESEDRVYTESWLDEEISPMIETEAHFFFFVKPGQAVSSDAVYKGVIKLLFGKEKLHVYYLKR